MPMEIPMESVGEIAAEHGTLSESHQLSDAIRPAEHADIGVNTQDENVDEAALFEKVEHLIAIVGDCVL
jgi:hypothetical protein